MTNRTELPDDEAPATATEDRLGRFLEEAMNLEQSGGTIDIAALLPDPELIGDGRILLEGMESLRRAVATTVLAPTQRADETSLPDPLPGEFRIRRLLGKGSFGKVWLADDLHLGRQVALKTLHLPADADPAALESLRKEAKILANLDHRNVVKVHAWRQAGDENYLVLEYVAGGSLTDLLREEGPMSWQRAARYIANVAEGLVEVHTRGIIHRDIKASNILWEPSRDEAKLTDFGVAGRLGATRTAVGTPVFMAPEALHGRATPASDVYSLAATLFHLTTGELPFAATTVEEFEVDAAVGLSSADNRFRLVPQQLEAVIRVGLSSNPADRPSLADFLGLLWGSLNQSLVDDFVPRDTDHKLTSGSGLRLQLLRRMTDGWHRIATSQPSPVALRRDIRRVPPQPVQSRVQTGEPLRLEVESDRAGYLAVYNVGPTGNLNLLYPALEFGDSLLVQAGKAVRIDDLVLYPPSGKERLFAVWSRKPLPIGARELAILAKDETDSPASRSCRDIVRVRHATEEVTSECQVVVLEVEHAPSI
jgi:serine/threonine protein kinase